MPDPERIGRKKNERIARVVEKMAQLKTECGLPAVSLIGMTPFSYASYMRWKRRLAKGHSPVKRPGVRKVAPLDLGRLNQEIAALRHGKKRSAQTGALYRVYKNRISRRELNEMVREVRYRSNRAKAAGTCRVAWHRPDVVWALDGAEYRHIPQGAMLHIQNLQDLCSRYKFAPLSTGHTPCGEEIAGHLDRHFTRLGPPLFLKRDNGGNLNHHAVDALLGDLMVIPINSPVYRAPYNGAIEHSQGELKAYARKWRDRAHSPEEVALLIDNACHALNHKPRRSLDGKNACQSYFNKQRVAFTKHERRAAYEWILELALEISIRSGKQEIDPSAWRIAARKWLEKKNLITISKPGKVSPSFPEKMCHI